MFDKLQDWIINKIPAQRKARDRARRLRAENKKAASPNFDSLPEYMRRELMEDATIAAFMRDATKGDERRYEDY